MNTFLNILIVFTLTGPSYCVVTSVNCTNNVCPYELVTYTCTVSGVTYIRWGAKTGDDIDSIVFANFNSINDTSTDYGLTMTLIDKTNTALTATVHFNVTTSFNDSFIFCDDAIFGNPGANDGCYISIKSFYPPNAPFNLSYSTLSENSIQLSWDAPPSTNADCISHYHISVNDGAITQTTQNTFATITELNIHTENMIEVAAIDKGNRTGNSTLIIVQLSNESTSTSLLSSSITSPSTSTCSSSSDCSPSSWSPSPSSWSPSPSSSLPSSPLSPSSWSPSPSSSSPPLSSSLSITIVTIVTIGAIITIVASSG